MTRTTIRAFGAWSNRQVFLSFCRLGYLRFNYTMKTGPARIEAILKHMAETLNRNNPPRITALRNLKDTEQGDPFKILIGTILSARSRDENTTRVIARLFARYKTPSELASADLDELKSIIHSIGFYNVKAARIKEVATVIVTKYGGNVPSELEDLLELPGVGRKTANCVLVYAHDKPAIPVDVHVHRISNRLGLVMTKTPEQTEIALSQIAKVGLWTLINDTFVMFGQNICLPRNPRCQDCLLKRQCEYFMRTSDRAFSS